MKKKLPQNAIEFQPDALEIKNEKMPFWARYSVWSALLFVSGAVLWACLAKVDVVVQASGKLVTNKPNIVMKPLERAVIKDINVKLGDIVKKDQILFTFDPTINIAESERLQHEFGALQAQYDRLYAEFKDKMFAAGSEARLQVLQAAIFTQRREFYKQKISYFDEAIAQLDASKKSREDSLRKQKERLAAIMQIEEMFVNLRKQEATSLKDLLQISISRMEMEGNVDTVENSLLELKHQRESMVASKNSFIQEWRNATVEELVKTEREISGVQKQLEKNELLINYVYLRSPCDAMVLEIAAFCAGSAVREAEALITLVPLNGTIELEAEIRPQDIGKVEIGSEVRIKLNAYPFQKHGTLEGVVRNLSEDTIQREQRSADGEAAGRYYRARVTVAGKLRQTKNNFRLIPGMEAQAEIKSGRRRIIEYLLYPLIKAFDETAREP